MLIIDDEKDLCRLVVGILSDAHYEADCAYSLLEGKQKWESWNPDVVLLDVNLPDGTGLDLMEANKGLLEKTFIILLTADIQETTKIKAHELGIMSFVAKPFTAVQVLKMVDNVMLAE